jgi:hypothetical protein
MLSAMTQVLQTKALTGHGFLDGVLWRGSVRYVFVSLHITDCSSNNKMHVYLAFLASFSIFFTLSMGCVLTKQTMAYAHPGCHASHLRRESVVGKSVACFAGPAGDFGGRGIHA